MNNGGEGDEASIMRILWDIGDPANEAHDRVALGHDTLFRQLRAIDIPVTGGGTRGVQSLHDVWDHFTGGTADTATRVNYGAIFEKYGVSPEPTDDFAHPPLLDTGGAPTFHWLRQNNGANDTFELLVFTSDLSTELLDVLIPGNVTAWTMDAGDWASLAFSPGTYKYVIVGGDGLSSTGAPLALADRTLGYWSDAYDLVVVPAPGALAVCGVFVLVCRRRTRAT
jgi:hypothetical protein